MDRRRLPVLLLRSHGSAPQEEDETIGPRESHRMDRSFADPALDQEGRRVTVDGFVVPPLKSGSSFLVLTWTPMAECTSCEPDQTWPDDFLPACVRRVADPLPFGVPMGAMGLLDLTDDVDPAVGFPSKRRPSEAIYERG